MTAANEFPLRNLFNTFTIFNFNTFITFNITLTPLILYLANTLKIPVKYLYKKRLKSLLEVFLPSYLHVQYFEETGTIKAGIN